MKILVIDDEKTTRYAVVEQLGHMGFTNIIERSNGIDGYESIVNEQPQVVIADIRMPGLNGIELLHKIRLAHIDTVYIILSGYDLFSYAKSAIDDGAFAYLLKPVENKEFEDVLNSAKIEISRRENLSRYHKKVQTQYELSRQALIQQFLTESVFYQTYSLEEFKNRATLLGITFPYEGYFIAVVRIVQDDPHRFTQNLGELIQYLSSITSNKLDTNRIKSYHFSSQGDLCYVCNYSYKEIPAHNDLLNIFSNIEYECRKQTNSNVYIAISRPCKTDDWLSGYTTACNVIDSRIMSNGSSFYENSTESIVETLLKNNQKRQLIDCMVHNRIDEMDACLDMIFEPFFFDLKDNTNIRNNFCLYIIMLCIKTLDDRKIDSRQFLGDEFELYREACSIDRATDSLSWIRAKLHLCADKIYSRVYEDHRSEDFDISDIENYLRNNYASDLTLKSVAEKFHYTPSYLSRMFKERVGKNFTKYLSHYRLAEAKRLLIGTQLQINKIAKQVGFNDYKHFVSEFKKHTGHVPISYREHFKKNQILKG